MANYYGITRTNYFKVKDEAAFHDLMSKVITDEGEIIIFDDVKDGQKVFGFGCYGSIEGLNNEETEEYDYELFTKQLQELLPDDEAVIITEVGNEKLRYVGGFSVVITSEDIKTIDLWTTATETAGSMLGIKNWCTVCSY